MRGVHFYLSILAFVSGIFVRSFFVIEWPVILWVVLIVGVLGMWCVKKASAKNAQTLFILVMIGAFFMAGVIRLELDTFFTAPSQFVHQLDTKVELKGVVVTEPEVTAKSTRLVVTVGDERVLVSTDRYAEITYGDEVVFSGKLEKPKSFETEFGRTFDYPGYLAVRDIFYTVSFAQVTVVGQNQGNKVLEFLFAVKQKFLTRIQAAIPEPEVGLGAGLLLGVKSSLGQELEDDFRTTGIIHIVVLSGANIMLVVIFVMYMLALVLPVRPRAVIGILAIVLFALLVGLSATVVRASIMASLILASLLLDKRYDIMRALFFAGAIMLIINPLLLVYDVGFQLSFLATLGLIVVAPQFELLLTGVSPWFKLKEYFIATVATQVVILPLLLYQIGQLSVVSVVVNLLVLPMVPLTMLTTFLTGVAGFIIPSVASLLGFIAYFFLAYIIQVATWFADLPYSAFVVPAFPLYVMVIMYLCIVGIFFTLNWYLVNRRHTIDYTSVAGWIIEEESHVLAREIEKERPVVERSDSTEKSSVPIFFR